MARHATPEQRAEILDRFLSFDLTEEQHARMADARDNYRAVATYILNATDAGREQSLALTALEEAKYWTNQAIARERYQVQKPDPQPIRLTDLIQSQTAGVIRDCE